MALWVQFECPLNSFVRRRNGNAVSTTSDHQKGPQYPSSGGHLPVLQKQRLLKGVVDEQT
eukprot:4075039-Amphidinium_carterae.2